MALHVARDLWVRIGLARQVAIESAKIVAGGTTEDAEIALLKLRMMGNLDLKYATELRPGATGAPEEADAETQEQMDAAVSALASTKEGSAAAAEALATLIKESEIVSIKPKYKGAFRARLNKSWSTY